MVNREVLRGMVQDVLLFPGVCACFPRYATLTVAAAEDAAEQVVVDYEELEPVTGMRTALDAATPMIHAALGDNLAFERRLDAGAVDIVMVREGAPSIVMVREGAPSIVMVREGASSMSVFGRTKDVDAARSLCPCWTQVSA